jgi:exopolysaccharide biosynthesis polyprenyl glycosylphosphotransferase
VQTGTRIESSARLDAADQPWVPAPADAEYLKRVVSAGRLEGKRWGPDALRRRLLALADIGAAAATLLIVSPPGLGAAQFVAALLIWVLAAKLLGLYDRDHREIRHLTIEELGGLTTLAAAGAAGLGAVIAISGGSADAGELALIWAIGTVTAFVLRAGARRLWRAVTPPGRTLIAGDGPQAAAVRRKVELFTDMHLKLVEAPAEPEDPASGEAGLDRLIIASERFDPHLVTELAGPCREFRCKLSVVTPLRVRSRPMARLSQVADLPVLEYETWDPPRSTMLLKRALDLAGSLLLLVVLSPLLPIIAAAILIDSRGPVLFVQRRAGLEGRPFRMFKFRTMSRGAEDRLSDHVRLEKLSEPVFKLRPDPRVTRVGRVLRRYSLDELPQLLNVVKGDMSLVGPRPEQVEVVDLYGPEHRFRLEVRPGLTGPMQVYGRGDLTLAERLAVEEDYIENISLPHDLRILALTLPTIFSGRGAY